MVFPARIPPEKGYLEHVKPDGRRPGARKAKAE